MPLELGVSQERGLKISAQDKWLFLWEDRGLRLELLPALRASDGHLHFPFSIANWTGPKHFISLRSSPFCPCLASH